MREDFWYISEEQCWTFFLLGLFTEHNLILGNQHKQRSPCLSAAKRTEVTACSSKSRLSLELSTNNYCKYQVWQQLWHVSQTLEMGRKSIWGVTVQVSHLISDIFYQRQCPLAGTSSCRAHPVESAQRHKSPAPSSVTLAHGQHTVCISLDTHFLQCRQPSETLPEHSPRRKVRWPCYSRRCFGLESLSPGWTSPRAGKPV